MGDKPQALTPNAEGIPSELKARAQWVLWRYLPPKDGKDKWRKVPHQVNRQFAKTNDPTTWTSFDAVCTAYNAGDYDGIGYVFTDDDGYVAIDFDHAFNEETRTAIPSVNKWIVRFGTYTELSASGTGIHALLKADYPYEKGKKNAFVEVYKKLRFFTVTGVTFDGLPAEPQPAQEVLDDLLRIQFAPKEKPANDNRPAGVLSYLEDAQIVERCRHAKNSLKFLSLWEGRWQGLGYPSQSEAEYGLLGILHFWTQDTAQLDRLMRASGLCRGKWDSKRGDGTYGSGSVGNIVAGGGEVYSPESGPRLARENSHNGVDHSTVQDEEEPEEVEPEEVESEVTPTRYTLHWLSEAFGSDEPVDWVVSGLFQRGSINLVHGAPGTKKTYALLDLAMCLLDGNPWLDHQTTAGTVLLIDEESGPKRLKRRLKEVARGHEVKYDGKLCYTTLEMFNLLGCPSDLDAIETILCDTTPSLVIVDALADIMPGGDENEVKDTHPVFQKLKLLAHKYNCCVVVIHHSNKGGKYRGSSAIPGVVDVMIKLDSPPKSGHLVFTIEKNRDGEENTFGAVITFDTAMGSVRLVKSAVEGPQQRDRASVQHVLEYLQQHDGGAYIEDIIARPSLCSAEAARGAVYELAKQGRIVRTDKGGRGAKAYYELG